jgi:mannose-6-phosphate isomerase-like protein (cupin superfamily)
MQFKVTETSDELQTATMVLAPGEASGPMGNEHPQSEQMLYLVEGELEAEVGARTFSMSAGESVIVPKGADHRFRNAGKKPAVTFNVYSPPAY